MSFFDLVSLILDNLGRRKARVALTAIGVVIGTAAVILLVSLAIGLQMNATQQLYGINDLSLINVYPNYGGEMVMAGGGGSSTSPSEPKMLTNASLDEIRAIPGVVDVIPREYFYGSTLMEYQRMEGYSGMMGYGTQDLSQLGLKLEAGEMDLQRGTAVIGKMVPNNFYNPRWRPGMEEPQPPDLLGETVKLILIKWDPQDGTEIRKSVPLRIVGILEESRTDADYSVLMRMEELTQYNEWAMGTRIDRNKQGYNELIVKVEDVDEAIDISDQIIELGYQAVTPLDYLQGINSFFVVLQVVFGGIGAISLLVAAIGIANTMTMAILERTREIGLMKAVGATNRDVLSVFLGEAAGIGFIGGLGGMILGWSAAQIMNVVMLAYMAGQAAQQGGPPPSTGVYTPVWLPFFALFFATLIGLISGFYPALRAATLVPVTALKYE